MLASKLLAKTAGSPQKFVLSVSTTGTTYTTIYAYDFKSPTSPNAAGTLTLTGYNDPVDMVVDESTQTAYVLDDNTSNDPVIVAIDISDTFAMSVVDTYSFATYDTYASDQGMGLYMDTANNRLYATTDTTNAAIGALDIIDASTPSSLSQLGRIESTYLSDAGVPVVDSTDAVAFVLDGSDGLISFDVSTPASPSFLDDHAISVLEKSFAGLDASADLVFVYSGVTTDEITVMNTSVPSVLSEDDVYSQTDATNQVYALAPDPSNTILYIYGYSSDTRIWSLDYSTSTAPSLIGNEIVGAGLDLGRSLQYVAGVGLFAATGNRIIAYSATSGGVLTELSRFSESLDNKKALYVDIS